MLTSVLKILIKNSVKKNFYEKKNIYILTVFFIIFYKNDVKNFFKINY